LRGRKIVNREWLIV